MMKKAIKAIVFTLLKVFHVFPIQKDKIFLMSFNGTAIGYDSKAFADWCIENNKKVKLVWGVANNKARRNLQSPRMRMVKINSLAGLFDIVTSKAIIFNINAPSYIPYRKAQVLINTWHGYPFKKVGKYVTPLEEIHFNRATAFISHSEEYTKYCIDESFGFSGEVIPCGAPRNDIFFSSKVETVGKMVKEQYGAGDKQIVLWMPTFRGDFEYRETGIDFGRITSALERRFGGEWVLFARLHPALLGKVNIESEDAVNVSAHQDAQELLCCADILISDYSSAMWDFSLLRRPVFVFADDLEIYKKERGLYRDMSELPYIVTRSDDELENAILCFDQEQYQNRLAQYFKSINCYESGNSSREIYEYITRNN